jgi:uncharacterized lipoprotein YbaY
MKSWQTWVTAAAVALTLAACGSTEEVTAPSVNVSIGQQLIDLKKARDSGALSAAEYERQKANLIAGVK